MARHPPSARHPGIQGSHNPIKFQILSSKNGAKIHWTLKTIINRSTYFYSVTASNATGDGAAATTNGPTLPAPVTSLTATGSSATQVHLSWADASVGATGYNVYRSNDSGQHFTLLTTIHDISITTYDDTVTEGTAHVYRIAPIDAGGEGAAADASITTVPATPTLTSATPISSSEIDLAWTNNSTHATGFTVKRTIFGANTYSTLTSTLAGTATSFADTTALDGTQYQYKVIAQGAGGNSADSNVVAGLTYPAAVSTLTVHAVSTSEIDLSWTGVTGATTYKILRSTDGSMYTQVDSISGPAASYQDSDLGGGLTEGTRYYYEVVANNATGDSTDGNAQFTSTFAAAPSGLMLTVISNTEVDLAWTNNSSHQASVGIEKSINNSTWTLLGTTHDGTTAGFQDTSVTGGHTYYYRVSAIDEAGTNYMSDVASVSALTVPDGSDVTATANTDGTVSLNWTTPTSATTFNVQQYDGSSWTTIFTGTTATSETDTTVAGDTAYIYRVQGSTRPEQGLTVKPIPR